MKIILFNPKINDTFLAPCVPLGILSIATYLNANGHNAMICDRFFSNSKVDNLIASFSADFVGISVISHAFINDAIKISKQAKSAGKSVVWGGPLASALYKEALKAEYVDYVCINEGEATWLEMADAFEKGEDFEGINGLAYKQGNEIVVNPEREFLDLTTLPDLDWSLINPESYFQRSFGYDKQLHTYMSKGCTGKCIYCYNPNFHKCTRRCRSIDQVMREMKLLVDEYGADGFDFTDDLMFSNVNEMYAFCSKLSEYNLNICWSGFLSFGVVNELKDYEFMYRAGCRSMIFGVESGSVKVLKKVNKANRLKYVKDNLEKCVKAGIVPITMFMLGFPDEDAQDIRDTIELVKSLSGVTVSYSFVTPLPGTAMYEDLIRSGRMVPPESIEDFGKIKAIEDLFDNFTSVPTKDLIIIKRFMRLRGFVTGTKYSVSEQLVKVLINTIKSWLAGGLISFVKTAVVSVFKVMETLTIFLYPGIRKKYGLYFKK